VILIIKKIIKNFLVNLLEFIQIYGFDIQKIQDINKKLIKIRGTKDPLVRLNLVESLVNTYPKNPKAHLEYINCLHSQNDSRQFESMNTYAAVMEEWLIENKLSELNIEFISLSMVVGSFGNHFAIENLLKANKYGLRKPKKIYLLLPEKYQLRNPALFSYFEPYINVIRDSETIDALKSLESNLTLPLGVGLPLGKICPFLDIVANMSEVRRIKLGIDEPLFKLKNEHHDFGKKILKKLGLPDDAWYVTLHVREPGYRGENKKNTTEQWRNANCNDYIKSCKAITDAGGWVFRMGDDNMTPLPEMKQVIDYAHSVDIRSDIMDIFLGATCRFLIGTASGYLDVPKYFGVPIIFTNCTQSSPYFNMKENDLYLPRLLKDKKTHRYLSFEEYMSPPLSMIGTYDRFNKEGLVWVENTPEEIKDATLEMLKKTSKQNIAKSDDDLQRRFKLIAEKCGRKYGGHSVKAFASISQEFIHKHSGLLLLEK
tara:strand:- start:4212 stop:5666 length:1455 start_codon:yes stop_codon:yes gene_type:complete